MMTIGLMDANSFVKSAILDSVAYRLRFDWNDYMQQWFMDVCQNDNTDLIRGLPLVANYPLLKQYRRHSGIPPGELLAVLTNESVPNIGRDDFINGRAQLVYVPEVEVNDIMEASVPSQISGAET